MAEPVMKYGARKGRMSMMRQWIANASADDIRIFPVPGADILRCYQNATQQNLITAPNPREANVLLVVGELTDGLAQKAGVAYQQIPRPRVLVLAGPKQPPYLPEPDVQVSLEEGFLDEALPKIQKLFQHHAWSEDAEPWTPAFLVEMVDDSESGGGHHHHHDHGNGNDENDARDHGEHDHGHEENHENHEESQNHHESHNHENGDYKNHENHDHGNGGHDHGDMDFMSMVAMTKDLPRPKDGLPMNRSKVHFGPFHPGLPGGLPVLVELDGDTVIEASVEEGVAARSFKDILPLDAGELPDALTPLNPLTPQAYRLLAQKALASALHDDTSISSSELIILESERIASHLNWLAIFGKTTGNEWLHQEAARWHALHRSNEYLPENLLAFLGRVPSMPYLKTKLRVGRVIPDTLLYHLSGPVAKAAGKERDARSGDKQYQELGWKPIVKEENSAWGRLLVRLEEIGQSFQLILNVGNQEADMSGPDFSGSGEGAAKLESPRGTLSLAISVHDGVVEQLQMTTPSTALAGLVPTLTEEAELSDALVQIASLDMAPWEIGFKGMEVDQ